MGKPFRIRWPTPWEVLIAILMGLLFKLPIKLGENAVTGWIDDRLAEYFNLSSPSVVAVTAFAWNWIFPFVAAAALLWLYHEVAIKRQAASEEAVTKKPPLPEDSAPTDRPDVCMAASVRTR